MDDKTLEELAAADAARAAAEAQALADAAAEAQALADAEHIEPPVEAPVATLHAVEHRSFGRESPDQPMR